MRKSIRRHLSVAFVCGAVLLALPAAHAEQQPPPIKGVTGTIALEGTVDQTSRAGKTLIVKTVDGIRHLVDRVGRVMSIRLADGSTQTLRLTDRAATDVGRDVDSAAADATRVVVYYADEAGQQVAHYFKRIS
jgi:hypothetical protein